MDIVLASGNPHKARELSAIFSGHNVLLAQSIGVHYQHAETGTTFAENAHGKARTLREALHQQLGPETAEQYSVLADDSGICVDALGGAPGVFSARYGDNEGTGTLTDADRNALLLKELEGVTDRQARFICAMVLLHDADRFTIAQEAWHGTITHAPSSAGGGFGYDPLFYVPDLGCTAADLPADRKNELSHRGRASRVIRAVIDATQ